MVLQSKRIGRFFMIGVYDYTVIATYLSLLPREKDVQIDPVAGVDQKAEPTGGNARFITI